MNALVKGLLAAARTVAHKLGIKLGSDLTILECSVIVTPGTTAHALLLAPYPYSGPAPLEVVGGKGPRNVYFRDGRADIPLWHDHEDSRLVRAFTYVPTIR